ncbi:MAG: tetratricopeptide repeat protein [Desulfocapsaceae bacterium]|nr:tetratricopeptide repeat protein [Desulfocapsaceae bacterium]
MKALSEKNCSNTGHGAQEITMKMCHMKNITIIIVLLGLLCGCSSTEEKKMNFYSKGVRLYEQGDYIKANIELSNALQLDPNFADAFYERGLVELKKANPQLAYGNFIKAVEKNPNHIKAHLELAKLFLAAKMQEKAKDTLQTIFRLEPQNREALSLQARLLLVTGKTAEASGILQDLLSKDSKKPEVYLMLASLYLEKKDVDGAEKLLQQGAKENPGSIELKAYLVNVYDMQNRTEDAIAVIKELIGLEPDKDVHKVALAKLFWKTERRDEARKFLDAALTKDSKNVRLWKAAASFYLSVREAAIAEEILQKGIAANKENFELRFALQQLMVQLGRYDDALQVLQECLKLDKDPAAPGIIDTRLRLADTYFARGDIENAEEQVLATLKENPKSIEGLYLKGRIDLLTGNLDNAVAELRQVVNERPDFVDAHLRLSEALLSNKQEDLAVAALQTARNANPDNTEIPVVLARLFGLKKDMPAAEDLLRKVVGEHPDDQRLKVDLGNLYSEQAKYEKAEAVFKEIVEQAPAIAAGYIKLGQLYVRQGDKNKAIAAVLQGYQANPESSVLLEELVKFNLAADKYDAAIDVCRQRINKMPEDAAAHNLLGRVYMSKKEFSKAEEAFNKAVSMQPQWQEPYNNLAAIALLNGKADSAIEKLKAGIKADPKNGSAYSTLGALYEKNGDTEKAIQVYENALAEIPNDWVAANNLSFLLGEQSTNDANLKRALKLARLALELNPGNPTVLDTVGWAYQRLGDHEKAFGYMERAVNLTPEQPLLNYHLGMILYTLGKKDEAREKLKKAVESAGDFKWKNKALETLKLLS